jgi:large subunit ribosomal protein L23
MIKKNILKLIDLIKYPVITEKSTNLFETNQYTFIVDKQLTKQEVKLALEFLFNVRVKKVNLLTRPRKTKRIGTKIGYKSQYKKAIIHLSNPDKINLFNR